MLLLSDRACAILGSSLRRAMKVSQNSGKINRMHNIESVSRAVAEAISQTRKFAQAEHKAAMDILSKAAQEDAKETPARAGEVFAELADNIAYIGNLSAIRQKLEKCGAVKQAAAELDAFQRNVLKELEAIEKDSVKDAKDLLK